jgi:hypothetical protein
MKTATPVYVLPLLTLLRCSSSSPAAPSPAFVPPPASVVVDDGSPVKLRREAFVIDGFKAPPNPKTGAVTPPELNRVRVVRYRVDADPPRPARAVFIMMPGFLGGAGSLDGTARAMVRRSTATDAIEAWAVDRRSNLLEDTHGLDVAEVTHDASQATSYYFDGATVAGKSFEGFHSGSADTYASEWGLATTIGDLQAIVALVPAADRASRIVLLGHSLGGAIVEEYAAWDFGGAAGTKSLAGLVLVDGVAGGEGAAQPPMDENAYANGAPQSAGAFGPQPGVETDIRGGSVFTTLPFLGTKAYVVSEYVSILARTAPDAVAVDATRDGLLSVLLGQSPMPKLTNRAAFGFAFDVKSCGLQIAAISCGEGKAGPITEYDSVLGGKLSHPSDPSATYAWTEFDQTSPHENTSIDDAARAWYEGPGLNFAEWYFPQRLSIDAQAARTLNAKPGDWRVDKYGLLASRGSEIDVPIFAVGSVVAASASAYDGIKTFAGPIGTGRPQAGKPRTDPDAFSTLILPTLTHIDWVVGTDASGSPVGRYYDALYAFAIKSTPAGGVTVAVTK